mmetsp:Transcript_22565/g.30055  ORF Transcript_22565/g.30055 Transcript_22565/m.30055 type:complete len:275 (-) Transcript_22565:570-1394(-)
MHRSSSTLPLFLVISSLLLSFTESYSSSSSKPNNRRAFLSNVQNSIVGGVAAAALSTPTRSLAAETTEEDVYFGVGCFWHIQHEFVQAERTILGRTDAQITSRTGYAGGTKADKEGRVCYHNFQGVADYGKLGHGEVVGMKIPTENIGDFAKEYFSYFSTKTGERVDPMDRGGEYRYLLGLPGGTKHPMYAQVEEAATAKNFKLEVGKGNEGDTIGRRIVYVYDTATFPFYQAEVYHQFHDDFQSPAYGKKYNSLAQMAFDDGRLTITGCPDRV